ncbi:NAD(P)H-dependent oxidoreductase [Pelomonas sp. KK5]|uniref:glutathione-regulated potassium-efflux system oxidoreductase KefF n=1 Tax=Pelomonas sp. KK5 TaxID=1855730 RepID=UPI001301DA99|nr:NAD(P)H-dependent oxidoreductase [Pelomonas sp. KK5]
MADILILAAHPDLAQSHITHTLLDAAFACADRLIEVRDLYRLYPDYAINAEAEQRALEGARLVVLLHPLHWYGMPALLKLWIDEVLKFGWAYGPGGQALRGKDLWVATSAGGSAEAYSTGGHHGHPIETFLLPYERTALLCGMRWLPPLVVHDAHRLTDAQIDAHGHAFGKRLLDYPAWATAVPLEAEPEVPLDERPALFSSLDGEGN